MQAIITATDDLTITARVAILRAAQVLRHGMRAAAARGVAGALNAARCRAVAILQGVGMSFQSAVRAVLVEMRAIRAALA